LAGQTAHTNQLFGIAVFMVGMFIFLSILVARYINADLSKILIWANSLFSKQNDIANANNNKLQKKESVLGFIDTEADAIEANTEQAEFERLDQELAEIESFVLSEVSVPGIAESYNKEQEEANEPSLEVEYDGPFELMSLNRHQTKATYAPVTKAISETWFEFSLPSDLVLNSNHPIWISAIGCQSLGYVTSPADTFSKLLELFHPEVRFTFLQVLRTHLRDTSGQTPLQISCKLRMASGEYIAVEINAITERTYLGQPSRLRGYWKEAANAIAMPESTPFLVRGRGEGFGLQDYTWEMPIDFLTQDYDICKWSDGFSDLLGYDQQDMPITCQEVRAMIHSEDYHDFCSSWDYILAHYKDLDRFVWKIRMMNSSGQYITLTLQGVVLNNLVGQPYRLAGTVDGINYDINGLDAFNVTYYPVVERTATYNSKRAEPRLGLYSRSA
jgi:hypothetical protein